MATFYILVKLMKLTQLTVRVYIWRGNAGLTVIFIYNKPQRNHSGIPYMLRLWIKRSVQISCFIPNVKAFANLRYWFLQNDINGHKTCLHIELICYYGFTT